jgi:hypothetical protein
LAVVDANRRKMRINKDHIKNPENVEQHETE